MSHDCIGMFVAALVLIVVKRKNGSCHYSD